MFRAKRHLKGSSAEMNLAAIAAMCGSAEVMSSPCREVHYLDEKAAAADKTD